nr:hypothetical protein BaRGS_006855 [Batillaria attramentaria]
MYVHYLDLISTRRNLNCTWLLEAPNDDHYIVLESVKLDLEAPEDDVCKYDYVSIYDGPSTSSTMMGERLCGETSFSNRSTSRHMTVVLVSDAAEEKTGFKFKYFAFNTNPTTGITEKDPVIVVGGSSPTRPLPRTSLSWRTVPATPAPGKTTDSPDQIERLNTGALIGGVLGGVCFVIIMGILCGRCVGDNGPRQPPEHRPAAFYHSHAPPSTDTSAVSRAVHMVQNNNAVFMVHHATGGAVSPSHLSSVSSGVNGVTNMAFSSSGDQLNASLTSSYARQDMASGDEIVTNDTGVTNSDNVTTERDGMVGRGVVSDDVDVMARDGGDPRWLMRSQPLHRAQPPERVALLLGQQLQQQTKPSKNQ